MVIYSMILVIMKHFFIFHILRMYIMLCQHFFLCHSFFSIGQFQSGRFSSYKLSLVELFSGKVLF